MGYHGNSIPLFFKFKIHHVANTHEHTMEFEGTSEVEKLIQLMSEGQLNYINNLL